MQASAVDLLDIEAPLSADTEGGNVPSDHNCKHLVTLAIEWLSSVNEQRFKELATTLQKAYFRPQVPPELEFDTDKLNFSGHEATFSVVAASRPRARRPVAAGDDIAKEEHQKQCPEDVLFLSAWYSSLRCSRQRRHSSTGSSGIKSYTQ
jgi:hypothetical protein